MFNLPTHPRTGVPALGWRRNGDPIWPVVGAAPDDDDTDDDQQDEGGDDRGQQGDDGGDDEGADQLGDAGKRALDRMKQQLREERKRRKAAEEKASAAGKKPTDGDTPDVDEIRKQAREEAAAESLRERVMDKIEAKARRFADPEDAAVLLLRGREIEEFVDGGKVDADAIAEALDELADKKPHLLARQSNGGSFDTGRGKRHDKPQLTRDDLKKMTPGQIQAARKDGRLDRLMGKSK